MVELRPHHTRGNPSESWINSFRTFYFPPYTDRTYLSFSDLQTINDDRVQPGGHVPLHLHRNMEIFGYVIEGHCHHTDNQGRDLNIPAGAVQRMSCGSGIMHTEGNSTDVPIRYLQLWVRPNVLETEPTHDWYQFTLEDKLNKFCDITEKLPIKQDARLLSGIFTQDFNFKINPLRSYYLYVITGNLRINDFDLVEGDGLSFNNEVEIIIRNPDNSEIILFDLK